MFVQLVLPHPTMSCGFDVIGLHRDTEGRLCEICAACGMLVEVNNLVLVKKEQVVVSNKLQFSETTYCAIGETVTCKVGLKSQELSLSQKILTIPIANILL